MVNIYRWCCYKKLTAIQYYSGHEIETTCNNVIDVTRSFILRNQVLISVLLLNTILADTAIFDVACCITKH